MRKPLVGELITFKIKAKNGQILDGEGIVETINKYVYGVALTRSVVNKTELFIENIDVKHINIYTIKTINDIELQEYQSLINLRKEKKKKLERIRAGAGAEARANQSPKLKEFEQRLAILQAVSQEFSNPSNIDFNFRKF